MNKTFNSSVKKADRYSVGAKIAILIFLVLFVATLFLALSFTLGDKL